MVRFEKEFLGLLVSKWNFYIDSYYSKTIDGDKWISILEKENYVYSVIIIDDKIGNIIYNEAMSYLKAKFNKPIVLNAVIFVVGDNYQISSMKPNNTLVYSITEESVIYSDEACKSLIPIFNYMSNVKKSKESKSNSSLVTYGLISINIIVFIISVVISERLSKISQLTESASIYNINNYTLLIMGAKANELINNGQWWRLITSAFLHGGLLHIVFNMYALKIIGSEVEYAYGKIKYIIIYFLSAVGGSIFSYIFNSNSISVGASGAVFGLFGAMLVFGFNNRDKIGKAYMMNILKTIGVNIFIGLTIKTIDNWAHIGGVLAGVIVAAIYSLTIGGKKNELKEKQAPMD